MSKYAFVMFKVCIFEQGLANYEHIRYCIGLDDVHNFVEEKRKVLGKDYVGHNAETVSLSSYAKEVITKGINH